MIFKLKRKEGLIVLKSQFRYEKHNDILPNIYEIVVIILGLILLNNHLDDFSVIIHDV